MKNDGLLTRNGAILLSGKPAQASLRRRADRRVEDRRVRRAQHEGKSARWTGKAREISGSGPLLCANRHNLVELGAQRGKRRLNQLFAKDVGKLPVQFSRKRPLRSMRL